MLSVILPVYNEEQNINEEYDKYEDYDRDNYEDYLL